jgi:hypothetical protein
MVFVFEGASTARKTGWVSSIIAVSDLPCRGETVKVLIASFKVIPHVAAEGRSP